ncbi:cation:proton antiporter subunit C [Colwellia sp. MB02u-18]|uniref:cation:proton antiporter subunit C n=1 Tax=unclassified Colwellia TaxID=196834 RepID=UPI0015F5DAE7|nr:MULTISPECIES: cation:proton antiporter subunit C [unclassified Colwellia]MBA6223019.1 cation:proton antiporter subunit C [Colwellia sp. MB3u-45]MBA6266188.1 cation:proton antiporter subunit C [Colwellia sp. MB3u-43]MBA6319664.1 cation:proton antiporter subunit C [Colwellia sp. MB02u-19]MBA6324272.1 cation:proton antiporter subunit C [Colwellia sp. MB02u-18]MBA6329958.1 cation:proton antiporter subunit C [Colwellia sp. MB02u-12]
MTSALLYSMAGLALFAIGFFGVVVASHVMRKILALNVMGVGIFMFLIALAKRNPLVVDPLPHALVLTGIVIAVAGTALALNLMVRIHHMDQSSQEQSK